MYIGGEGMKFEVFCEYQYATMGMNFYIYREESTGRREICTKIKNKNGQMEFTPYRDYEVVDPTFTLRGNVVKPFLQAMSNELHRVGIKPEEAPVLENELSAIKYHLEDMRELVFKKEGD
jgi:hypothetical protein